MGSQRTRALSGRRVLRALVALLGLACAVWTAQQFFHYEIEPLSGGLSNDVRVSDEEVSFQILPTSMPGAATETISAFVTSPGTSAPSASSALPALLALPALSEASVGSALGASDETASSGVAACSPCVTGSF